MNILVICHYGLYRNFSLSFVHAQVQAYVALGHRVRVIVPIAVGKRDWAGRRFSGTLSRRTVGGVELYLLRHFSLSHLGKEHFNTAMALRTLQKHLDGILDGFAPDVIHAHTLGPDSLLGAWSKQYLNVPLVVTTHGSDTSIPIAQGRGEVLKISCDHADAIVAISSALAKKVCTCGTKTPVSVILNGFHLESLPKATTKQNLSFIQVGHLQEQKRVHITICAFAQFYGRHPDAVLTIVGQGPERKKLEALCQELGVLSAVRFLGEIQNQKVLEELRKAQFFVMPSVNEGFGIVYLEAMASGCITIGTEGEGIADLIVSEKNGFLISPDNPDAIVQVIDWCLAHPKQAEEIAKQGRKDALGLTWEKNAAQYIRLFGELRSLPG